MPIPPLRPKARQCFSGGQILVDLSGVGAFRSDLKVAASGRPFASLTREYALFRHWRREALFDSVQIAFIKNRGPERGRTAGLLNAIEALYQLSYRPENLPKYNTNRCSIQNAIKPINAARSSSPEPL